MSSPEADYIIVGGGLTGCALASRLYHDNTALKIILLEAGNDPTGNPQVTTIAGAFALANSELDWSYKSVPQSATNDRVYSISAGKTLGGGSVLNYGGWSRGDEKDYDVWAKTVNDPRWSYAGLLPFFKKTETHFDPEADVTQYGHHGPMHITSVSASDPRRQYGLRGPIRDAWTELGVNYNANPSSGSLAGISECLENWHNGLRQPSHLAYSLKGVEVVTGATVHRVLFSQDHTGSYTASGVLLVDGRQFAAKKEIILSAGTIRTPQILMLSGIGPLDVLSKFKIPVVRECPGVGKNLFDHFAHYQLWKLRTQSPEECLALGSPLMTDPAFFKGMPYDWAVNEATPSELLKPALEEDASKAVLKMTHDKLAILEPGRCHVETLVVYSSLGTPGIPMDGTFIATSVMLLLPTSRGSVSITSASPTDPPTVDPQHYTANADRISLIHGTQRVAKALLETSAGKKYVTGEAPPPGFQALSSTSTEEEIDARIRATGQAHYHSAGTAAMGQVVDTDLRVYGVRGLRIADASVLPVPIGGHPQATLYALAEQAASIIGQSG